MDFDPTTPYFYDVEHNLEGMDCWCSPVKTLFEDGYFEIEHRRGVC